MCDTADCHKLSLTLQFVVTSAQCVDTLSGGPILPSEVTGKNKEKQNEYYEFTKDFNILYIHLYLTHQVD